VIVHGEMVRREGGHQTELITRQKWRRKCDWGKNVTGRRTFDIKDQYPEDRSLQTMCRGARGIQKKREGNSGQQVEYYHVPVNEGQKYESSTINPGGETQLRGRSGDVREPKDARGGERDKATTVIPL